MSRIIKAVHADDHELVRNAIKMLFNSNAPHIQITAGVSSFQELFEALDQQQFDLLLLDGQIIGGSTSEFLPKIRKKYPGLKILLLWLYADEHSLTSWIHLLDGHIHLNVNIKEVINAIEIIMS